MGHDYTSYGYDLEETETIRLACNGDHKAYAVLIGRYKHMVFTIAMRILRNSMDAEETTQDIFIKAYQKLNNFQGKGKFSTWLYSIAYRMSISALRVRKYQGHSLDELRALGSEPIEEPQHSVNDQSRILEQALTTLPPDDAAIITMFYLEEFSVEEIVTVTQLSASNIKVKLHRSRKKLYEELRYQLKDEVWTLSAQN